MSEIALHATNGRPPVPRCPACDAEGRTPAFLAGEACRGLLRIDVPRIAHARRHAIVRSGSLFLAIWR